MTVLLHVWSYNLKGMELKKTGYGPVLSHSTMHLPHIDLPDTAFTQNFSISNGIKVLEAFNPKNFYF